MPNIPGILRFRRNFSIFVIGLIASLFIITRLMLPAYLRGDLALTLTWLLVANVALIVSIFGANRLWRA